MSKARKHSPAERPGKMRTAGKQRRDREEPGGESICGRTGRRLIYRIHLKTLLHDFGAAWGWSKKRALQALFLMRQTREHAAGAERRSHAALYACKKNLPAERSDWFYGAFGAAASSINPYIREWETGFPKACAFRAIFYVSMQPIAFLFCYDRQAFLYRGTFPGNIRIVIFMELWYHESREYKQ